MKCWVPDDTCSVNSTCIIIFTVSTLKICSEDVFCKNHGTTGLCSVFSLFVLFFPHSV